MIAGTVKLSFRSLGDRRVIPFTRYLISHLLSIRGFIIRCRPDELYRFGMEPITPVWKRGQGRHLVLDGFQVSDKGRFP